MLIAARSKSGKGSRSCCQSRGGTRSGRKSSGVLGPSRPSIAVFGSGSSPADLLGAPLQLASLRPRLDQHVPGNTARSRGPC
eukprot:2518039-Rhodomonas_salina.2